MINMWGVVVVFAGFVMVWVGVKGDPKKVVDSFRPAGSAAPSGAPSPAPAAAPAIPGAHP